MLFAWILKLQALVEYFTAGEGYFPKCLLQHLILLLEQALMNICLYCPALLAPLYLSSIHLLNIHFVANLHQEKAFAFFPHFLFLPRKRLIKQYAKRKCL